MAAYLARAFEVISARRVALQSLGFILWVTGEVFEVFPKQAGILLASERLRVQ